MSEHIFTESEIEIFALLFLTQIKNKRKDIPVKKWLIGNIFSQLEDYLYHDVLGGYPITYIPNELVDIIPKLVVDEDEAYLFASYLGYCLLRRSDEYAIKIGHEPKNELDLLALFNKEKHAFKLREIKLGPTLLSQDIVEIIRRGFMEKSCFVKKAVHN